MITFGSGLDRKKSNTAAAFCCRQKLPVHLFYNSIEAVYHCDIYGARTVKVRTEVDISVFHRNLTAGMDGIFQKIAEKQA